MSYDERDVVDQVHRVTLRELRAWVRNGWVRPRQGARGPVYDDLDIARIRLLCDLRKEMAIEPDTLPVVLSLIDQLHTVRREFRCLAEAVAGQPEDHRKAVVETFRVIRERRD